jgi:hypothetical protein
VPTLLLQGGEDLRTPPETSAHVAALIPGAERVVVPGVGHGASLSDPSGCATMALLRFLQGRPAGGDCPRVATGVPAVAPAPRRLAGMPPLPGLQGASGRVARTAAAVGATLDDLRVELAVFGWLADSGGGLRGGTWRAGLRGIVLTGYEAVGGVRVSGGRHGARLVLRVAGRAAARGTLTVAPSGRFRGRLGGRHVAGRLPHRPPTGNPILGIARASRAGPRRAGIARASRAGVSRAPFARVP